MGKQGKLTQSQIDGVQYRQAKLADYSSRFQRHGRNGVLLSDWTCKLFSQHWIWNRDSGRGRNFDLYPRF